MKQRLNPQIIVYLIVFSSYSILLLEDQYVAWLTREDGLIENLGALLFAMTFGLFILAYYNSPSSGSETSVPLDQNRKNVSYLLLGILFMICFGEEISWGQRIFKWETPELFQMINSQGETNIHNIWLLNGMIPGKPQPSICGIRPNMNAFFSVFWLLFCVIVPLMNKVSGKTRFFLKNIRIPIVPFWIGGLFLSHAIFFHVIYNFLPYDIPGRIDELRETNYAFMFFVFACHENIFIRKERTNRLGK